MATDSKIARTFRTSEGIEWGIEVMLPSHSNAMVVFRHPNGGSARLDRYAWFLSRSPESHDVTSRLDPARVLESLSDRDIARLFRRSMAIEARRTMVNLAVGRSI